MTVEYVLWLPFILGFVAMVADATLLMQNQSQMFLAARDGARQVALGQRSEAEIMEQLAERYGPEIGATTDVRIVNGFVTVDISAPFAAFTVFGAKYFSGAIGTEVSMWVERAGEV